MRFNITRVKKNIVSGISSQTIKILIQIFYPPLMILFWGLENFGVWIFLLSIPNIVLIFNFNFTDASVNEMAIYNAKKKYHKSNEIFQNTIVFLLLNIFIFSLVLLIFFLLNKLDFTILEKLSLKELKIILFFLLTSVYLRLFESLFATCLNSVGKIYIGYNLEIAKDFFSKFFIVLAGIFYDSLVIAALIFFLLNLLKFIFNFYFFMKYKNKISFSFKLISKKIIFKLIKLSIGHMSDLWANLIKHSGIIFIIGIFLNPYMVGYISTVKTLFYFMPTSFFGKINFAINFELSNLYGSKKMKLIKTILSRYIKITFLLILAYLAISFAAGPYIYHYWLNNEYELNIIFLLLIVIDSSFFVIRSTIVSPFAATNKNITLGISDLILTVFGIFLFFLSFHIGKNYIFAFSTVIIFSFTSLIFASFLVVSFFKNTKNH